MLKLRRTYFQAISLSCLAALLGCGGPTGSYTVPRVAVSLAAPSVTGNTPTNDTTPTWRWETGGGGNGTYRYKLDNSDLASGATETTETTYTPSSALSEATHTLYIQERDSAGNWSSTGSFAIVVDTTLPDAPTVSATTPTKDTTPTWTWSSGGGSGLYRYSLDDPTVTSGTETTSTSYTPTTARSAGQHILYVQERDSAGNWSSTGSFALVIDTTSPTVSFKTPASSATNVGINTAITVLFSEAMDSSTIDTTRFTLAKTAGGAVSGTVSYDSANYTATFTPSSALAYSTAYTITIGSTVADAVGNLISGTLTASFTTYTPWATSASSMEASPPSISADYSKVSTDPNGNAVAVWQQSDGTWVTIYYNRYTASTNSWSSLTLANRTLENAANHAYLPKVGTDASGNAFVLWYQSDGSASDGIYDVYYSRFTSTNGAWSAAAAFSDATNNNNCSNVAVAVSSDTSAIGVWQQYDSADSAYSIYARRYTTAGLGAIGEIDAGTAAASNPDIAIDSSGNAIAVWRQWDGTYYSIYASYFTASTTTWSTATLIESNTGDAGIPRIAMSSAGKGMAVWPQWDGSSYSIYGAAYSTGWGAASLLESGSATASDPRVAIDSSGNATAVWIQSSDVYANRYSVSPAAWGTAELLESADGEARQPAVSSNSSGSVVAVWSQYDSTGFYRIYSNYYDTTAGSWNSTVRVDSSAKNASNPEVSVDVNGRAIATWTQVAGAASVTTIYANRFTP